MRFFSRHRDEMADAMIEAEFPIREEQPCSSILTPSTLLRE